MAKTAKKPAPRRAKSAARKGGTGKPAGPRKAAPADAAAAMRAALLDLCGTQGWRDLSLAEIAEAAGLDMAAAHATYPTKAAILVGLARAVDAAILTSLRDDPLDGTSKDRLFDLLMRRFDHLQQQRDAYLTLLHELPQTPLEAAAMGCQMRRSLRLMLETAGISASGLKGHLRLQGLIAIYLAGLRAWARDESADLAHTMAEIDKRLGQAAKLSSMMSAGLKRAERMKEEAGKAAKGAAA
ncbi:TetR family transcriptional regulator [Dongia sp.]|uniref:TetR family transcriptional regulator n=1 Tax=Dongia sp. TaxID=1977262 RepID=UPI0035B07801